LKPEEIAFIGDRLDTDIVCARRAGVPALLVTTGVTSLADARRAKGELRPDAVFPELESLTGVLLDEAPDTDETSVETLPTMTADKAQEISELETETAVEAEAAGEIEDAAASTPDAEAAPATDELMEVPVPKSKGDEGWDETWFDDAEQSAAGQKATAQDSTPQDSTPVAHSSEELPTIVFDDTENAAAEAVPDETAPTETAAEEAASPPDDKEDDGFNWKLD
jgi:hypothetical protein